MCQYTSWTVQFKAEANTGQTYLFPRPLQFLACCKDSWLAAKTLYRSATTQKAKNSRRLMEPGPGTHPGECFGSFNHSIAAIGMQKGQVSGADSALQRRRSNYPAIPGYDGLGQAVQKFAIQQHARKCEAGGCADDARPEVRHRSAAQPPRNVLIQQLCAKQPAQSTLSV